MGIMDILNASKIRKENDGLKELMSPELQNAANINEKIAELEVKYEKLDSKCNSLSSKVEKLKKEAIYFEDAIFFQDYGLYEPRYSFLSSDEYKNQLTEIRSKQKQMIKNDTAISGIKTWAVDGSRAKGKTMINNMKKLFLRAFNSDCEDVITKVKYSNYEMSERKIRQSASSIEKLGKTMMLKISSAYIQLKVDELCLAFEYALKKQEEKERLKELRAQQREEAKLKKEIAEQRKKIAKEQKHYSQALESILKQIERSGETTELIEKKAELENALQKIEKSIKNIDYREANQRAGYVYVISNVGSFGKDIYKIGMTRRLDPQDRVDELGDASVPFNFDVHAMIFSDDAPALESALHKAFEDRKVNMVNTRREFFNVSLDEIKKVIQDNYDKTVEFIDFPDAEQYRMSLKMKESIG